MKKAALGILGVVFAVLFGALLVLWIGSSSSLDDEFTHTRASLNLPAFAPTASAEFEPVVSLVRANGFTFRARTAGFGNTRGNVVLLHGFPETSAMYLPMISALAQAGFQVVAFDQRGYSPGARPESVDEYTIEKLMSDVFAVATAVGFEDFHLVGHDWGAAVGWAMVFASSDRIQSWSALSIPHLGAYGQAIENDQDQAERSGYIDFFRTPWFSEAVFAFNDFAMMREAVYGLHDAAVLDEYMAVFSEPGALTAALNWYRASGIVAPEGPLQVEVPTAFIWGNRDPVVGNAALEAQEAYFEGNLWKTELDAGHWLMEEAQNEVVSAVLEHLVRSTATEP